MGSFTSIDDEGVNPMFKQVKRWLNNLSLSIIARIKTREILEILFVSPEAERKYSSVQILKKEGKSAILGFIRHVSNKERQIVHSQNPMLAMRQELVKNIQAECLARLLVSEEFHDDRELFYKVLNEGKLDSGQLWSDELVTAAEIWIDLVGIFLRMLNSAVFPETKGEEWTSTYSKAYEGFTKELFHSIRDKNENKSVSVDVIIMQTYRDVVKQFELNLFASS